MPLNDGTFNLINVDNVTDDDTLELDGARSTTSAVINGTTYLFVAGQTDDGISVFSIGDDGTLTNVDNIADNNPLEINGAFSLTTAVVDGTTYLFAAGHIDHGLSVFSVGDDGTLTNVENLNDNIFVGLLTPTSVTTAVVGGTTYLFVTSSNDDALNVFAVASDGTLTATDLVLDDATLELDGAQSSTTAQVNGTTYLFVAGFNDDGVSVFSVANDGTLTNVDNFQDDAFREIEGAFSVATAVVEGTTFLFVAGFNDNGVSVFFVADDGTLTSIDNVRSDLFGDVNLDGVTSLTTEVINGITYLFVSAAQDNEVSVFTVNLNGTLSNVTSVSDNGTFELGFASSVTTTAVNGETFLFVTGLSDDGVSVFRVLASTGGNDVLVGGAEADQIVALGGDDMVEGLGGDDLLTGGGGDDTLDGGQGNDFARYDQSTMGVVASLVTGTASGADVGFDTLISIENLIGGSGNDLLIGDANANSLNGGDGNDQLDGGAGADALAGGDGSDIYIVDNVDDTVFEFISDGIDTVNSTVDFTLSNNVEQLVLSGAAANGTGNNENNVITAIGGSVAVTLDGGFGNDVLTSSQTGGSTLNGGEGADTLISFGGGNTLQGGLGSDTYFSFGAGDIISEAGGDGIDTVFTSTDIVVGEDIEQVIVNIGATSATSNSLDDNNNFFGNFAGPGVAVTLDGGGGNDLLFGGDAGDTLIGGEGIDLLFGFEGANILTGGNGNDAYFSSSAEDKIFEDLNGGFDTQFTSVAGTTTIADNVEQLVLFTGATKGIGNENQNFLFANSSANGVTLEGLGGDDLFIDSAQSDTIIGGMGNDQINLQTGGKDFIVYESAGFGNDIIFNFTSVATGQEDFIDVSGLGFTAADIGDKIKIEGSGANTLITIQEMDTILLIGIDAATIDASDFVFAA